MTGRSPWRSSVGEDDDDGEGEEEAVARGARLLEHKLLDSCLLEVSRAGRDGRRGDRFGVARTKEARERWDGSRCVPLVGPSRLVRAQAGSMLAAAALERTEE